MLSAHSNDASAAGPSHPELGRVGLVLQYQGTRFHGWQRQARERTVQAVLEDTIGSVLRSPVVLHGAGRTDTGVHAAAQVAHFDAVTHIPAYRWASILNHRLPEDVVVRASFPVSLSWHARFSALWRRYRYTIYTDARPNLFVRPFSWHYYHSDLNVAWMADALKPLLGQQHLAAFHRAGSRRAHSWVEVQDVSCVRRGAFVQIEIQASGFLYGMVRLLVGLLVDVGRGQLSPEDFTRLWQEQRRHEVKYAAPPQGLCLLRVGYEDFPVPQALWFDSQPQFLLPTALDVSAMPASG